MTHYNVSRSDGSAGPAFEMRAVRVAAQREEIVSVDDDIHTHVPASTNGLMELPGLRGVFGMQLKADPDG